MTYEDGFDQGERTAYRHRKVGIELDRDFPTPKTPYDRGYIDGYCPRSPAWWAGLPMTAAEPQGAAA